MVNELAAAIELPPDVDFPKVKPKGLQPSFDEFSADPKAYSIMRGMRPTGLRTHVIMPTTVQVNKRDVKKGIYPAGVKTVIVDILRKIDFSVFHGRMA